jgi:hypothetical protein
MPEFSDSRTILAQFNLLMEELLRGGPRRGKFRPWEIEILLDIEQCNVTGPAAKREVLQEYQKAVQAELEKGANLPLMFSEYLERQHAMGGQRKPASNASRTPSEPKTRVR